MKIIQQIAQLLSAPLNLDEMLTHIMKHIEQTLRVAGVFLFFVESATGDLVLQLAVGHKANDLVPTDDHLRFKQGQGVAGQAALQSKAICLHSEEELLDFDAHCVLAVPLQWQGQVISVLEVIDPIAGYIAQDEINWLRVVGSLIGPAIHNARLYDDILIERDRVIAAEEAIRRELARNLHDYPIQLMSVLVMHLEFCLALLREDPTWLSKELSQMRDIARRATHQMRTMLFELRPLVLETAGLEAALNTVVRRWQEDLGNQATELTLMIRSRSARKPLMRQEPAIEATIFTIVQEAIHNALKHAQATEIIIQIKETATGLYATVADNGLGFDVTKILTHYTKRERLGMVNLRERTELIGGDLIIFSKSGLGTLVRIYVPYAKAERTKRRGTTGRLAWPQKKEEDKIT